MKFSRYQTINDYLQVKRRLRKRNRLIRLASAAFLIVTGFVGSTQHEMIEKIKTRLTEKPPRGKFYLDYSRHVSFQAPPGVSCFQDDIKTLAGDYSDQIPLGAWVAQLPAARAAWAEALPGVRIPNPNLKAGICEAGISNAIACANKLFNTITISMSGNNLTVADRHTILMHEIGHLLGVPHIDGDPLMNLEHKWNVQFPTRAAIALAKLANGRGW